MKFDIFIRDEEGKYISKAAGIDAHSVFCGRAAWNSSTPNQHGTEMLWQYDTQRSIVLSTLNTLLVDSARYTLSAVGIEVGVVYLDPVQATPAPSLWPFPAEVKPLFELGNGHATPAALSAINKSSQWPSYFLDRHLRGDWGDICDDDKRENAQALIAGNRIMSVYKTKLGDVIWCITEADRSVTTLLLPSEY